MLYRNEMEFAEVLLNYGADLDAEYIGDPPLYYAIYNEEYEFAETLLEKGAKLGRNNYLAWVLYRNEIDFAKVLLDYGADVDAKYIGETPLYYAINNEAEDIALEIIGKDAKLTDYAYVAMALYKDLPEVASALIAKGADTTNKKYYGNNAEIIAAIKGYDWEELVQNGQSWLTSLTE